MKNWKFQVFIAACFAIFLLSSPATFAQQVQKSQIKENIDGREYYLHFVKPGETLYNIARAYNITVDDIFKANETARDGIRAGNVLKLPVEQKSTGADKPTEKAQDDFFYHIVKRQETLFGISKQYNVTITSIQQLNPFISNSLKEGETIKIPYASAKTEAGVLPQTENKTIHQVSAGETLYGIARQYHITTGELINANPALNPQELEVGQKIIIPNQNKPAPETAPVTQKAPAKFTIHAVDKGETLYSIARQYAVSIDTLKKHNQGLTVNLYIGQKINIPQSNIEKNYLVYTPERKEDLNEIANKYRIDAKEVTDINPGISKKVKKGQEVKIPVVIPEVYIQETVAEQAETTASDQPYPCPIHPSVRQTTFNVALMLPLFLQEVDSLEIIRERGLESTAGLASFRFLNFYAGFKMAVDSMEKAGMKINLFIYDVDNDPNKANLVLQKSELSSMDLIVGPLYAKSFSRIAKFANTYQIPIVNPLSTREEIIGNNPYVFKLKPAEEVQTDLMVRYLLENHPDDNIVVVRHNKYKYQSTVSYLRNNLNAHRPGHVMIANSTLSAVLKKTDKKTLFTENKLLEKEMINRSLTDSTWISNLVKEVIYVDDSVNGLEHNLSKIRNNLVVALSDDPVFTKELLSQLNKLHTDHPVTLFGLPNWNQFQDMETNQLLNLQVHTFTPAIIDFNDRNLIKWIDRYRKQFHTEPTTANFAFDGFDTGWYFLNALYRYGTGFTECIRNYNPVLIQTQFHFESKPGNGFQNIYWNLGKYQDYSYKKVIIRHFIGDN